MAPQAPRATELDGAMSLRRLDVAVARVATGFGALFFLLSLVALESQADNLSPLWVALAAGGLALALGGAAVRGVRGRAGARAAVMFAAAYPLAVVTWPLAVIDPERAPADGFWLHQLLAVALVAATMALPLGGTIVYVLLVPALVAAIRVLPAGGAVAADLAVLDAVHGVVLGGLMAIFRAAIRGAAHSVDTARARALARYTEAVHEHAADTERIEVDAMVHDSVLTTLLAASRAESPAERQLVTTMAAAAIARLGAAGRDEGHRVDEAVAPTVLAARLRSAAAARVPPIPVRTLRLPREPIPRAAADALLSAAEQAMTNSIQHAGEGVRRWVTLRSDGTGTGDGLELEVGDDGVGFDPAAALPGERLGVRVSIVERMAAAGGRAELTAAPGRGTRVVLYWPVHGAPAAPSFEQFQAGAEREQAER